MNKIREGKGDVQNTQISNGFHLLLDLAHYLRDTCVRLLLIGVEVRKGLRVVLVCLQVLILVATFHGKIPKRVGTVDVCHNGLRQMNTDRHDRHDGDAEAYAVLYTEMYFLHFHKYTGT